MTKTIRLQTSAILHVPLSKYDNNFTFIVNGEIFKTNKFVADLLSEKIALYHFSDPTIDEIHINTRSKGDFHKFLQLQTFESNELNFGDLAFISEIINELQTTNISIEGNLEEITIDNVIERIENDEKYSSSIFNEFYDREIEFISSHFSEIISKHRESFKRLSVNTIENVINHQKFQLENEDELLQIINELYLKSNEYSILYEYVVFTNVSSKNIEEFINIFDMNDLNIKIWGNVCYRLKEEIKTKIDMKNRYKINDDKNNTSTSNDNKYFAEIQYDSNKKFSGILNFLRNNSNIDNEIKLTASSIDSGNLKQIIQSDFPSNNFHTKDKANSWICIEFIKHRVIPKNYKLRSNNWASAYASHPRKWIFEGSNDSEHWENLDSQTDCSFLKGQSLVHTFPVSNEDNHSFKYLRIRQTGKSWGRNNNFLCLNFIEFYGKLE